MHSSSLVRRLGAASLVGTCGALAAARAHLLGAAHCKEANTDDAHAIAQLQKQADKARRRAQERVRFTGTQEEMLGMTPKLWLEALDEEHDSELYQNISAKIAAAKEQLDVRVPYVRENKRLGLDT